MEPKRLQQYAKLCRKLGIQKLSIGDVTIELDLTAPQAPSRKRKQDKVEDKAPEVETIPDEDLLYWSSSPSLDNQ